MCRSIKRLVTKEYKASDDEIRASSLQFVRKISGMRQPSAKNNEAFNNAVEDIFAVSKTLLTSIKNSRMQ